jgi:hypothetical protein
VGAGVEGVAIVTSSADVAVAASVAIVADSTDRAVAAGVGAVAVAADLAMVAGVGVVALAADLATIASVAIVADSTDRAPSAGVGVVALAADRAVAAGVVVVVIATNLAVGADVGVVALTADLTVVAIIDPSGHIINYAVVGCNVHPRSAFSQRYLEGVCGCLDDVIHISRIKTRSSGQCREPYRITVNKTMTNLGNQIAGCCCRCARCNCLSCSASITAND